jgi:RNA polymerase sigma factor (sigma-70 family)
VPDRAALGDLGADSSTRLVLLDGIADLPLQMRAAVVLRYYADLSVDEIAATLGKSPNTIKAQLQVALDRLRTSLAEPANTSPETSHA